MSNKKVTTLDDEFKKNPELKREDIDIISKWVHQQSHLPKISDLKIAFFLHSCYYKLEPTKSCIENYYTIKTRCPEVFKNRRFKEIKPNCEIMVQYVLPFKTQEGYSILFVKLIDKNPEKFVHLTCLKGLDATISIHFHRNGTSEGHVLIVDTDNCTMGHFLKLNLLISQKYIYYLQQALHIRIKGIHLLGSNVLVQRIITTFKPFLSSEIFRLVQIHKSLDELNVFVPKDVLPKEYGGKSPSLFEMRDESLKLFEEYDDFLARDDLEINDESKRIEKVTNCDHLFGSEGSFRSLAID
ncbi:alpha-tocopherol transfer protein-like [Onthophagus taurus]|uniref:alpha-tocopherol transfer protein-like n=1 Tax=Onthophagus taurus TaxID=166361 RepID=UPI0039BDBD49